MPKHQNHPHKLVVQQISKIINLMRNQIKREITNNENTQVPCYVSERLLRLDQATRNSMHTQVPGLSVLPRKHRHNNNKQRVRYHNNIIRSIIISIRQIYHARFQVQRLRVIIDYTTTPIILTIHHKHICTNNSNFIIDNPIKHVK